MDDAHFRCSPAPQEVQYQVGIDKKMVKSIKKLQIASETHESHHKVDATLTIAGGAWREPRGYPRPIDQPARQPARLHRLLAGLNDQNDGSRHNDMKGA
jgi:hypothetical protein